MTDFASDNVELARMTPSQAAAAAALLARSMPDNPTHARVFGTHVRKRQNRLERFFAALMPLVLRKGSVFGVWTSGRLIGVLGMLPPGTCRSGLQDILAMIPTLAWSNSPVGNLRMAWWLRRWMANDPAEPHWHLGPLAVDPDYRRQGIATQLAQACLSELATQPAPGWLETDKYENVVLYQRYGFEVVRETAVLGTRNWFMWREAKPTATRDAAG